MGMRLVRKIDFPSEIWFVPGNLTDEEVNKLPKIHERTAWTFKQKTMLELTHNWGSSDNNLKHHDGNSEPKGFGHMAFSVPDVYAACKRFEQYGVEFIKKPDDGSMKGLAFIKDPDGYWIEILNAEATAGLTK